jgi:hypothetical protein
VYTLLLLLAHAHTLHNNSVTGIAVDTKGDAIISGYVTNAAGNEDFFAQKVTALTTMIQSIPTQTVYWSVHTKPEPTIYYTVAVLGLKWM